MILNGSNFISGVVQCAVECRIQGLEFSDLHKWGEANSLPPSRSGRWSVISVEVKIHPFVALSAVCRFNALVIVFLPIGFHRSTHRDVVFAIEQFYGLCVSCDFQTQLGFRWTKYNCFMCSCSCLVLFPHTLDSTRRHIQPERSMPKETLGNMCPSNRVDILILDQWSESTQREQ